MSDIENAVSPNYQDIYKKKAPNMDELVYFSASFHCIPLRLADSIREHLMQLPNIGQFNFDYSQPIIPEED